MLNLKLILHSANSNTHSAKIMFGTKKNDEHPKFICTYDIHA